MRRYSLLLVAIFIAFADDPGGCAAFAKGVDSTQRLTPEGCTVHSNCNFTVQQHADRLLHLQE